MGPLLGDAELAGESGFLAIIARIFRALWYSARPACVYFQSALLRHGAAVRTAGPFAHQHGDCWLSGRDAGHLST